MFFWTSELYMQPGRWCSSAARSHDQKIKKMPCKSWHVRLHEPNDSFWSQLRHGKTQAITGFKLW